MLTMTTREMMNWEVCRRKGYLSQLHLSSAQTSIYGKIYRAVDFVLKTINLSTVTDLSISESLNEQLQGAFLFEYAQQDTVSQWTLLLSRYFQYEKKQQRIELSRNLFDYVSIGDLRVGVSADFVYMNQDGVVELIRIEHSVPQLSYRGRKRETRPEFSTQLLTLFLLGIQKYPNHQILASIYYLRSKDDDGDVLVPLFEKSKGKNIVSHAFTSDEISQLTKDIVELQIGTSTLPDSVNHGACDSCSFSSICKPLPSISQMKIVEEVKKAGELHLTDAQHKAISFRKGIARINAGAGSGKTTVMALRVAELLKERIPARDILMITFSNKGAQEMREKVDYWLKMSDVNINLTDLSIMTFHAWGNAIIQKEFSRLGFTAPPKLVEKVDIYDVITEIISHHERIKGYDYRNPLMDFINAKGVVVQLANQFAVIKAKKIDTIADCKETFNLSETQAEQLLVLYEAYNNKLKERNLIEYQDQINLLLQLMTIGTHCFPEYRHILVDEYQDTDKDQFEILSMLTECDRFESLMVVGDDSQSIFGFRYTSVDNLINFHQNFFKVEDIYFVENFRSTPEIIQLANHINKLNEKKIDKELVSKSGKRGNLPALMEFLTEEEEYQAIISMIKKEIQSGTPLEEIAIIARTRAELHRIQEKLQEAQIPSYLAIPEYLLINPRIQILLSLIDFFQDTTLTSPLFQFLFAIQGITATMDNEDMKQKLDTAQLDWQTRIEGMTDEEKMGFYLQCGKELAHVDASVDLFVTDLESRNFVNANELFSYLRKVVLYEDNKPIPTSDTRYQAITLTTAHSSKGKEWGVVINTIDKYKAEETMEKELIEEERRLLFVSITRAKSKLILCYHQTKSGDPNLFVRDLKETNQLQQKKSS